MNWELVGKSLELLKETAPNIVRVGVIWNPENAIFQAQMLRETQRAAARLGVDLRIVAVRNIEDFGSAFARLADDGAHALLLLSDPAFIPHAARIARLADEVRLPAMYGVREHAEAGGLMSYGTNFTDLFRRTADYVDKILKGADPAELPVEQPTRFEFVINLKAAKLLDIDIPATLLARADEVIE
jgi:putative ABC transport system substrate-binding protein